MEHLHTVIDFFLHLHKYLEIIIQDYGTGTYLILFLVIFAETGLVVTPFLPGDSLLFAVGAFGALGSLNVHTVALLLFVAAILGDAVNYAVGKFIGPKVFQTEDAGWFRKRFLKKEYLDRTQHFYEKYGGKTIILARFVPIVRTFAPFLAGVGTMSYSKFLSYNVIGAALWVVIGVYSGYLFGNIPVIKNNFTLVVLAIVFVSVLPVIIEVLRAKSEAKRLAQGNGA